MLDIQNALTLLERREARDAARMLEQMVDEMPAYATARVLLARSYESMNDWDRATAVWYGALQLIPNSPVVRDGLKRAASRSTGRRTKPRHEDEAAADTEPPAGVHAPAQRAQDVSPPTHMPPRQHMPPPLHEPSPREPSPQEPSPRRDASSYDPSPRRDAPSPRREGSSSRGASGDLSELQDVDDPGTPHYEDLDRLINELESARIVPRPDLENVPSPDLEDDIEDVVSETLARIYASQGQYDEAARVYELLAGQHPEDSDEYLQEASRMRSRASDGE